MLDQAHIDNIINLTMIQCLALISPGPDFAIVLRHSIQSGKTQGLFTAFGITCGVFIHVLYSSLGFSQLITQYYILYWIVKIFAFLYLSKLAYKLMISSQTLDLNLSKNKKTKNLEAFKDGLFTNILNPKCIIFFLSIFSVAIEPNTPLIVLLIDIAMVFITTFIWFCLVASLLSSEKIRAIYFKYYKRANSLIGVLLIFFAFKLLID